MMYKQIKTFEEMDAYQQHVYRRFADVVTCHYEGEGGEALHDLVLYIIATNPRWLTRYIEDMRLEYTSTLNKKR